MENKNSSKMLDEFRSTLTRLRIASLQSHVLSKGNFARSRNSPVRRQRSRVTLVQISTNQNQRQQLAFARQRVIRVVVRVGDV
ncbi:hypothetical protein CFIMG_006464RAa [Ceratocystis fimbriata CBS 114723]|uniref:Uncharacterized protein n=1 Tax=Ceratocystis fimbriata CBS 114723 TaxID=1035309 RepID=A0A2C5WYB3_9PEZI|nr:hypothetical protein CFIMG_006464RAa [Ceratocystis fimbriata CBS 114723]